MQIEFNEYTFEVKMPTESGDPYNVYITLKSNNSGDEELWNCNLRGLWKDESIREDDTNIDAWKINDVGDYFQESLNRNKESKRVFHGSYTALFHEMIKNNRDQLKFINNLYSTSQKRSLSFGFTLQPAGKRFWKTQEENGLAEYIPEEERYKALL